MNFVVLDIARGVRGMWLRLEGPFQYPQWVVDEEDATKLSKTKAWAWASVFQGNYGGNFSFIEVHRTIT